MNDNDRILQIMENNPGADANKVLRIMRNDRLMMVGTTTNSTAEWVPQWEVQSYSDMHKEWIPEAFYGNLKTATQEYEKMIRAFEKMRTVKQMEEYAAALQPGQTVKLIGVSFPPYATLTRRHKKLWIGRHEGSREYIIPVKMLGEVIDSGGQVSASPASK